MEAKMTKTAWYRLPPAARRDLALARWAARPRRREANPNGGATGERTWTSQ